MGFGVRSRNAATLAAGLAASQSSSRQGIRERFAARGVVTADVLKSYIADLVTHEQQVATAAFGFQPAVFLNRRRN